MSEDGIVRGDDGVSLCWWADSAREYRAYHDTEWGLTYGIMYGMKRTTVYLPDELKAALERTAAAQGRTEAAVVRSALEAATAAESYPRPRLPLFESGDRTLAERVDEELAAGFGA